MTIAMRVLAAALVLMALIFGANACPEVGSQAVHTVSVAGPVHSFTAFVDAGGTERLSGCDLAGLGELSGYVKPGADFRLVFAPPGGTGATFRVSNMECDEFALVHTPNGVWHYVAAMIGAGSGSVRLTNPPSGDYSVWIGTLGNDECDSRLSVDRLGD